jgi:hypothetical protein
MKMEQTVCSEMAYKIQTLGNYPEESIKHDRRNYKHLIVKICPP